MICKDMESECVSNNNLLGTGSYMDRDRVSFTLYVHNGIQIFVACINFIVEKVN